jgi:predicted amidohydrolase
MKAGFIQLSPVLGNLNATMNKVKEHMDRVAAADLIVLPELCNSGYNFESPQQAWDTSEPVEGSAFLESLHSVCARYDRHIVTGFNERDGDRLYNSAVLIGPGGVCGKYRKLHLFLNEKDIFTPGDAGLPVFDIGGCRLGLLICFDWVFPEAWRVLALKGADVICHPSNLVIPGLAQKAVPVHALINRVYIITANRTGREGDLSFTGMSLIAGPRGEVLCEAGPSDAESCLVEIAPAAARDKMVTPRNHLLQDRRPDEYMDLVKS